jgi:hypothetical protein
VDRVDRFAVDGVHHGVSRCKNLATRQIENPLGGCHRIHAKFSGNGGKALFCKAAVSAVGPA